MTAASAADAARFMDALRDWLIAKKDPRIKVWQEGDTLRCTIENLPACAADFCQMKAEEAEAEERLRAK